MNKDMLGLLSAELIQLIGLLAPVQVTCCLIRVNKRFRSILDTELFWRIKYSYDFSQLPLIWAPQIVLCEYWYQYRLNHDWNDYYLHGQRLLEELQRVIAQVNEPWDDHAFDRKLVKFQPGSARIEVAFVDRFQPLTLRRLRIDNQVQTQIVTPINISVLVYCTNVHRGHYITIDEDKSVRLWTSFAGVYRDNIQANRRSLCIQQMDELSKYITQVLYQGYWPIKRHANIDTQLVQHYSSCIKFTQ